MRNKLFNKLNIPNLSFRSSFFLICASVLSWVRSECQWRYHFLLTAHYFSERGFRRYVVTGSLESRINLHESPVSQAHQVVLEAQGPLLFLYPLALRVAHAHQAPPDSVIEPEWRVGGHQEKQSERQLNNKILSFMWPTERGWWVRQPVVLRSQWKALTKPFFSISFYSSWT